MLVGYGYAEIIPAMTDPLNNGNDSTNENLQLFCSSICKRGIASVTNSYFNNYCLYTYLDYAKNNYKILQYILPIIVVQYLIQL